jgi:hypothetical protein
MKHKQFADQDNINGETAMKDKKNEEKNEKKKQAKKLKRILFPVENKSEDEIVDAILKALGIDTDEKEEE